MTARADRPLDDPVFFPTPNHLRGWFDEHHESADLLWVGYYKKATGRPSVTWEESRDQALCFGWIDGLRRSLDESAYKVRFTPRRPGSKWSLVNLGRVGELEAAGLMTPAGLAAFAGADEAEARRQSEWRGTAALRDDYLAELEAAGAAWEYLESQPPSYRRDVARWIMDAKREGTRRRRLAVLIEDSLAGRRIKPLRAD
ncbi:MAG: YdeI/OmpD-associated family protein [Gemmatimonadota bacterium]